MAKDQSKNNPKRVEDNQLSRTTNGNLRFISESKMSLEELKRREAEIIEQIKDIGEKGRELKKVGDRKDPLDTLLDDLTRVQWDIAQKNKV